MFHRILLKSHRGDKVLKHLENYCIFSVEEGLKILENSDVFYGWSLGDTK